MYSVLGSVEFKDDHFTQLEGGGGGVGSCALDWDLNNSGLLTI